MISVCTDRGLLIYGPSGQMFFGPSRLNFELENIFLLISFTSWAFIYLFIFDNESLV